MTRVREYFSNYREEKMNFLIEMGNKSKCTLVGRGTVTFQRESGKNISFSDVLHVPGLTKNLILVSVFQDMMFFLEDQECTFSHRVPRMPS